MTKSPHVRHQLSGITRQRRRRDYIQSRVAGNSGKVSQRKCHLNAAWGTSLVVQWLRFQDPNAGELSSIPGQGTRSDRPQQRQRIPSAATKTQAVK